ncbi:MAG: CdaR family protein [Bacteroidales bacterium]|nr:CdaR family protein [Bacteroidales bacterium]
MIFLFFVCIAFGFWILQTLQQEFEITTPITINYKDMPEGYALIDQPTKKLQITVQDKGAVLLNYIFGNKFAPIELNLTNKKNDGTISFNKAKLESIISKQLINTTRLIKIMPDSISLHYGKLDKKSVPVRFAGNINPAAGYLLDGQIEIDPQTVEVYAPNSILDTLSYIATENISLNKLTKKINKTVRLDLPEDISTKSTTVEISANIEEAVEKRLEVPISCDILPKGLSLKLFPPKVEVTCRLPISKFISVNASDFKVEVFYNDLINNKNGWVIAKITRKPDFVDFAQLSVSRVDFILEELR